MGRAASRPPLKSQNGSRVDGFRKLKRDPSESVFGAANFLAPSYTVGVIPPSYNAYRQEPLQFPRIANSCAKHGLLNNLLTPTSIVGFDLDSSGLEGIGVLFEGSSTFQVYTRLGAQGTALLPIYR